MIALKDYQSRVLDSLRAFFREARATTPSLAFASVTSRLTGSEQLYRPVVAAGLDAGMPYICLRVPTGGGKTLLACHAAGLAMHELQAAERTACLWLVPSNTILQQTLRALRDSAHPYRIALEQSCGPVEVLSIDEALQLPVVGDLSQSVVLVGTMQSFRIEDTAGRKVYEANGALTAAIGALPSALSVTLLRDDAEAVIPSLVNLLRSRRPIVIVDEAHNARTDLSFATLGSIAPSCIVEFTATPVVTGRSASNVLHRVSAAELKAAEMVKLPLRVITRPASQRDVLLADAVALRADLERIAASEATRSGEYIRPILLLQAPRVDDCESLREELVAQYSIPRDQVAVSVGSLDELAAIEDLQSSSCPIRVIITVVKLREGWDCPFAYVLCSLRETVSATAIEQLIGRVIRMPRARSKSAPELNSSYCFSVSPSVAEVLAELRTALVSNGFSSSEAERLLQPVSQGVLPLGAQHQSLDLPSADLSSGAAVAVASALADKIVVNARRGSLTVLVPLSSEDTELLCSIASTDQDRDRIRDLVDLVRDSEIAFGGTGAPRPASPYERGAVFSVPRLAVREGEGFFEFESTVLLEHPWKLSEKDATLPPTYDPREKPSGQAGSVDVGGPLGGVSLEIVPLDAGGSFVASLRQHVLALGQSTQWTLDALVAWLDQRIRHEDIPYSESAAFLRNAVRGVMARAGLTDCDELGRDRHRLRDEIERVIESHRSSEMQAAFQLLLLPESALSVTPTCVVDFRNGGYEPNQLYNGAFVFKKHYFGPRPGDLEEATGDGKLREEFRCAQFIDALDGVEYWVRNIAQRASSFRVHTSTGWFYPDFVCKLRDGRTLVVEYKGGHLFSDAEEKRAVGAVWAARSGGSCVFLMPTGADFSEIERVARGK